MDSVFVFVHVNIVSDFRNIDKPLSWFCYLSFPEENASAWFVTAADYLCRCILRHVTDQKNKHGGENESIPLLER